jgi:TonB family protein
MPVRIPLRCLTFLALSGLFMMFPAQQVTPSPLPQSSAAPSYPDNSEELRQLLGNLLATARKGDRRQLQSMIQEMEIPNYETWFTSTFGQEKGESWAEAYEEQLTDREKTFEETMVRLAHTEGEFVVTKAGARRKYDSRNNPLDGYRADWRLSQATNGRSVEPIADFFFIEGKFRWDSTVVYFPSPAAAGGEKTAPVAANQRSSPPCRHTPSPPYTDEAKAAKIQGSVLLEGVIGIDGSITDVRVIKALGYGLDEGAVQTLKNWKCSPIIGPNGTPVPTRIPFKIDFQLY